MAYFSTDLTKSKLVLLYFLQTSGFVLHEESLLRIMLDNGWADYFGYAQSIAELLEGNLLAKDDASGAIGLTEAGRDALAAFEARLPQSSREAIDAFCERNRRRLRRDAQHEASYERVADDEYVATLRILEGDRAVLSLALSLVSREAAQSVCARWATAAEEVYGDILGRLSQG